ncbi:hypothetical protein, partial [Nocardiopsis lucentensis]|uniref:hypothetical protein n=1 Tax=Nocardiopsis lucentensis TaxID=53441 RepID=UPI00373AE662
MRRWAAAVVLALAATACQADPADERTADERPTTEPASPGLGPYEDVPSAVEDPADPELPQPLVD